MWEKADFYFENTNILLKDVDLIFFFFFFEKDVDLILIKKNSQIFIFFKNANKIFY